MTNICPHNYVIKRKNMDGGYLAQCQRPTCKVELYVPADEYQFMNLKIKKGDVEYHLMGRKRRGTLEIL